MAESPYLIRFNQLPAGAHEYQFRIDDRFFKDREGSIIRHALVEVQVLLHKSANTLQLDLKMKGEAAVDCVRCLETFSLPIDMEKTLLVRAVDQPSAEEDDIDTIFIAKTAHDIDLEHTLYDFLTLEIPYSPVHPDREDGKPGCNADVLRHIQQKAPAAESEAKAPENDRWSALRKIKLN